jgi:CPA1 family monovalent cation:H+ antiporter
MAIFDVLAVLMVLAAIFGWLNACYAQLPISVAVMAMGLALSLALVGLSLMYPPVKVDAERLLAAIDFDQLLLQGALGFLLFVVVAFSVLVQGLSMKALVRRYLPAVREG